MKPPVIEDSTHPDPDCADSRSNFLKQWFWLPWCTSVAHLTLSGSLLTQWLLLSSVAHHYFTFELVNLGIRKDPLRWAPDLKTSHWGASWYQKQRPYPRKTRRLHVPKPCTIHYYVRIRVLCRYCRSVNPQTLCSDGPSLPLPGDWCCPGDQCSAELNTEAEPAGWCEYRILNNDTE